MYLKKKFSRKIKKNIYELELFHTKPINKQLYIYIYKKKLDNNLTYLTNHFENFSPKFNRLYVHDKECCATQTAAFYNLILWSTILMKYIISVYYLK